MQLVDERAGERRRLPPAVAPGEQGVIDDPRLAVHTVRLPLRARIGERRLQTIDHEPIVRAMPSGGHFSGPPTPLLLRQGKSLFSDLDLDGAGSRSPDLKHVHANFLRCGLQR